MGIFVSDGAFLNGTNVKNNEERILRPLLLDETMLIEELSNKAFRVAIIKAKNIFESGVGFEFEDFGLNNPSDASGKIFVQAFELIENAKLAEIFCSFTGNLSELCFTYSQIVRFCEKYPHQLRQEGSANFFLLKTKEDYFVANIKACSDGLKAGVNYFKFGPVWNGNDRHRIFVPAIF